MRAASGYKKAYRRDIAPQREVKKMQSSVMQQVRCPICQQQVMLDEKPLAVDEDGTQQVTYYLATCGSCGHQGIANTLYWEVSATPFSQIPRCRCTCGCLYCFELRGGEDAKFVSADGTLVCRNCAILCLGELDLGEE
jgi:uncharacterized protein YbaR (Trm112 family)